MIIDCGSCTAAGPACDDCVVTVLLGPMPTTERPHEAAASPAAVSPAAASPAAAAPLEIPDEHAAAVAVLAQTGLIPPLRLVTRAS